MERTITVKVRDVIHDKVEFSAKRVEAYIKSMLPDTIQSVRISKGHTNSPIFLELDCRYASLSTIEKHCRYAVKLFSEKVSGVDIDSTMIPSNVQIVNRE